MATPDDIRVIRELTQDVVDVFRRDRRVFIVMATMHGVLHQIAKGSGYTPDRLIEMLSDVEKRFGRTV